MGGLYRYRNDATTERFQFVEVSKLSVFRERRMLFSRDICAAEAAPRYRQSSTGSVVIKALLPRRRGPKAL